MFTAVLVTGASGFVATHIVRLLLQEGYRVRGTLRDMNNELKLQPLRDLQYSDERLELVYGELNDAESWKKYCICLAFYCCFVG